MQKRKNKAVATSQLIADCLPDKPKRPKKPSTYEYLKRNNPDHHLVKEYEQTLKIYEEIISEYENCKEPEKPKIIIPELKPVNISSLANLFKNQFLKTNKKEFNPEANFGESNKFLWTLLCYFARNEKFYESPLLFKNLNTPSLDKGLLVIGYPGCGKTAVFKTFYHLLFNAQMEPFTTVSDIQGTQQLLMRYKYFFKYFTANQTVEEYENCKEPEEKEVFWKKHNTGFTYYDDILTERQASNYGKFELFKDIFEKRYELERKTMISCNYYGETVEETLEEFTDKYGSRVYDRLFSMFNIITLKGKSLRK